MNTATHLELIEGTKTQRDKFISEVEVLEKVKHIALLPYEETMTTEMVADFYEVEVNTIHALVFDNKSELEYDGYETLVKERLAYFKKVCEIKSRARQLSVFPRQAVLRVGMLLRDSPIAIKVRNYLLDVESKASDEMKLDVIESYFNKLEDKMNSQNEEVVKVIQNNNLYIIERMDSSEGVAMQSRKEISERLTQLENAISIMKNNLVFKQYTKPNHRFEASLTKFAIHYDLSGARRYSVFYNSLENWLGVKLPRNKNFTTKEYILSTYDIEVIEMFVDGIINGRIVESDKGHFIDLNGVFSNPIEWHKVKDEFNHECAYCGTKNVPLVEEHVIPQSHYMTSDIIKNIVPACQECNKSKNNQVLKEWYPKQSFYEQERREKVVDHYYKYNIEANEKKENTNE